MYHASRDSILCLRLGMTAVGLRMKQALTCDNIHVIPGDCKSVSIRKSKRDLEPTLVATATAIW